jgi:signal transduction histidine kinase
VTEVINRTERSRPAAAVEEALVPIVDDLARAFGCDRALVAFYDHERSSLRGAFGRDLRPEIAGALDVSVADADDPLVVALLTGVPQRIRDIGNDPRLGEHTREILLELGFGACVVAPLGGVGGQALGVIVLSRPEPFSEDELRALLPAAGRAGDMVSVARDVRLLHDTAEHMAVEKEWLWWMVNAVADPVIVTDAHNEIVLKNRTAELLFRSTEGDSPGKRHAVWMNNFLFSAAASKWTLEAATGSQERELTLVDPIEGTELIFEVIASPAVNYRAGARGTVSVLKNITQLRQVTEELSHNVQRLQRRDQEIRIERDRLELILRNVPNPIIVIDNDNQPITMNPAAMRLFGADRSRPAADRRDQITFGNETRFTSFIAQLRLDPTGGQRGELALIDPETDEPLEMAVITNEVRDTVGGVVATVSVLQDIGRLRELERRRLEQVLFDSEKLAATGRLAASIAHEINNPLEAIQNSLYILVNRVPPDDPNRRFLEIATKETERMSRILRQMLGFYRPQVAMGPTDVNALAEEAGQLLGKRLRDRGVRLEQRLEPLPEIRASADQLKQVLLNLLLNAAESMPEGGVVSVATQRVPSGPGLLGGGAVQIQVRDSGVGIPEEHLPHIFQPFFSTKATKGTGLGLWVSSGIVQGHGGTLQVRSVPGRGSTFTITLPVGGPRGDDDGV